MERRNFFERYRPTNLTADPLPLKVLNHSIWKAEMLGHALDWASQYLHQKNCPSYLISPLLGKVLKEMSTADLSDCIAKTVGGRNADEVDADIVENIKYQPLRLMQSVTSKVDDICLRYKEENDQIETDFPNQSLQDGLAPQVYGASYHTIKNTRRTLEDRMVILPEIERIFNFKTRASYFAVFDGHNGVEAAAYSAAHLHHHLVCSPDFPSDLSAAINYAFEATDTALLMKCKDEHIRSGTTAVIAFIVPGNIYVAWAGDSQAVLVRNSQPVSLVSPHKPDREDEMRRIKGVGGEVISVGGTWRVNGNLAVSRAIGNLDYKEYVTSTPEISHIEVNGSEEFLILACDGLWDVVSPQRSVEILRNSLLSDDPSDIDSVSHKLVVEAKQSGSGDNITVIVVLLKPKEELRKLYAAIKMNGSAETEVEAPVEVIPAEVVPVDVIPVEVITPPPVSPNKSVPKSTAASSAPSKTSLSPGKTASATKATAPATTRNPVSMRSPSTQKTPVKLAERRTASATTKTPLPPVKTTTSATKTTVQKDGVGGAAKPLTQRGTTGATSRTQLTSKPATTTTTTKKPLKSEETDKPASTRSVVPPRPRPGTAPLSSRLVTTKAPSKQDTSKVGDEPVSGVGKESVTAKRSVLNSARSTASKEGGISSRVTQPRPATSAAPKPRVPSTATTRPASAAPKAASTAAPKPGITRTAPPTKPPVAAAASSRPPVKKPIAPSATKKDTKVNGQTAVAPKSSDKKITKKEGGVGAGLAAKVNGVEKLGDISKDINGIQKEEVEEKIAVAEKVKDVDAPISGEKEKVEDPIEHVNNGVEKQPEVETIAEAQKVDTVEVTNENNEIESEREKEDHGKVINGDIAYEDFMVTKPYAVDVAENVSVDQVKHDDSVKSEEEVSEQVEKSVAQLSESETVCTLEDNRETEKAPVEVSVEEEAEVVDTVTELIEAEKSIEQTSPALPVVEDVVPEVQGVVEESNQFVLNEDEIATNETEPSEISEEPIVDVDSGLKHDLISDLTQENSCLKEIEEDVNIEKEPETIEHIEESTVSTEETPVDSVEPDVHQEHESLVVHDIPEGFNAVAQEQEQLSSVIDSFDPIAEVSEIPAFPATDVNDPTERQEEQETSPSVDVTTTSESLTTNPFADSYVEPELKEAASASEAFAELDRDHDQEKDILHHLVDSGEEQIDLPKPSGIETDVSVPVSYEQSHDTIESEFHIESHEQPLVVDCELEPTAAHVENENVFDSGEHATSESDNVQEVEASSIPHDDFVGDEKQTAIDQMSELQLEPEKVEEVLITNDNEDTPLLSEQEQGKENMQNDILECSTATTEDPFLINTNIVTDEFPRERDSPDLGYTRTEFDTDNFASEFKSQTAPLLDADVSSVVADFGFPADTLTTSQNQEQPQSQQEFDPFITGEDLLQEGQNFGNLELTQDVTNLKEQENSDFVAEKSASEEQQKPCNEVFGNLDFSNVDDMVFNKVDLPSHETVLLGNSNPFMIDTPMTVSKGNTNLEQINKNEIDVGFGFGNDNGIGSELHSSSGGCVDTFVEINSSNYPGSDTEIMFHQTSSDEGNHTGNLVDTKDNEDNDALAILNR